jgi:hypothetical protein
VGQKAIAGGFNSAGVVVSYSKADASNQAWLAGAHNGAASQGWIQAIAICATVAQ